MSVNFCNWWAINLILTTFHLIGFNAIDTIYMSLRTVFLSIGFIFAFAQLLLLKGVKYQLINHNHNCLSSPDVVFATSQAWKSGDAMEKCDNDNYNNNAGIFCTCTCNWLKLPVFLVAKILSGIRLSVRSGRLESARRAIWGYSKLIFITDWQSNLLRSLHA